MLRANASIMTILGGSSPFYSVYDAVPQNAVPPFIIVGEGEETDASDFGQIAHDLVPDIQVWDRDGETTTATSGSAGFKRAESIVELIAAALDADDLTVSGHDVCILDSRGSVEKSLPSGDDPTLRLVSLKPHILLEDS